MLVLVGYVLVVGSVFGGYTLAGGHLGAMYPAARAAHDRRRRTRRVRRRQLGQDDQSDVQSGPESLSGLEVHESDRTWS